MRPLLLASGLAGALVAAWWYGRPDVPPPTLSAIGPGSVEQYKIWASPWSKTGAEPILPARDIKHTREACAAPEPAFTACTAKATAAPQWIARFHFDPLAVRAIAECLATGCEGAFHRSPANACMWAIAHLALLKTPEPQIAWAEMICRQTPDYMAVWSRSAEHWFAGLDSLADSARKK